MCVRANSRWKRRVSSQWQSTVLPLGAGSGFSLSSERPVDHVFPSQPRFLDEDGGFLTTIMHEPVPLRFALEETKSW